MDRGRLLLLLIKELAAALGCFEGPSLSVMKKVLEETMDALEMGAEINGLLRVLMNHPRLILDLRYGFLHVL